MLVATTSEVSRSIVNCELAHPSRRERAGQRMPSAKRISGAPSKTWRFLQGESPCRTRSNQPFVPSVAVMKEDAKTGLRYTVVRENLGVEEGTTATSTSLETL